MNRIDQKFIDLKKIGKPAFMPFLVGCYPDYEISLSISQTLAECGDFLEVGFPFSDPLADGPTIQLADNRALKNGSSTDFVLKMISQLRKTSNIPITVLVYANLVLQKGVERFYEQAAKSGVDGVLIPDVPVEEIAEFSATAEKYGIRQIFLVTQTTDNNRLKKILKYAKGFLYLVSILGVTGARRNFGQETYNLIKRVRSQTNLPLVVGFGISSPEQFKSMISNGADGAIVASAIVDVIANNLNDKNLPDKIKQFAKQFKR